MDHTAVPDRIKLEDTKQCPASTEELNFPTSQAHVVTRAASTRPPKIIGLYGVSGVGKTWLKDKLEEQLDDNEKYLFFDGSALLDMATLGGLQSFQELERTEQDDLRTKTIGWIQEICAKQGKVGIVTGHFSFLNPNGITFEEVMTDADKEVYTHILYVYRDEQDIKRDVQNDIDTNKKGRTVHELPKIKLWIDTESRRLREECRNHHIEFTAVNTNNVNRAKQIIEDFARHDEQYNTDAVNKALDKAVAGKPVKTIMVFDADKTLSSSDASDIFFQLGERQQWASKDKFPCRPDDIFRSPLKYSYTAFRQATLWYEEICTSEGLFENRCRNTAKQIRLHPELKKIIQDNLKAGTVGVVVVTSGLRRVWEMVLDNEKIIVPVIGGGRFKDDYVVTPKVKGDLVTRLKQRYGVFVQAFGDSPVDIQMLKNADEACVVVGKQSERSKSMNERLQHAAEHEGLRFCQILLPPDSSPRLDTNGRPWPIFYLHAASTEQPVVTSDSLNIQHATAKSAARILATKTRDARVHGWPLQEAHRKVGWYLATEYVSNLVGTQYFDMPSVQKHEMGQVKKIESYRLLNEDKTCIVPLMRGGEALAHGIFEAFPTAMFLHAKDAEDIKAEHVADKSTIILADFVINTGDSILNIIRHIRTKLDPDRKLCIIVVAGVVQEDAVDKANGRGLLHDKLAGLGEVSLVALRISTNSFKGKGKTDTGHRLFNTTHLD